MDSKRRLILSLSMKLLEFKRTKHAKQKYKISQNWLENKKKTDKVLQRYSYRRDEKASLRTREARQVFRPFSKQLQHNQMNRYRPRMNRQNRIRLINKKLKSVTKSCRLPIRFSMAFGWEEGELGAISSLFCLSIKRQIITILRCIAGAIRMWWTNNSFLKANIFSIITRIIDALWLYH